MIVVGPSASNFFQGGDSTSLRLVPGGGDVDSPTLRRLEGRSSPGVPAVWACPFVLPSPLCPLVWPLVVVADRNTSSVGESGGVERADKGESADEIASSIAASASASAPVADAGFKFSVIMGDGRRGDRDDRGCGCSGSFVDSSWLMLLWLLWCGISDEAADDALGSVIATRGGRDETGKGVGNSTKRAFEGPENTSVCW